MNSEIKKYGKIRKVVLDNYVKSLLKTLLDRHADVLFDNGQTAADEAMFKASSEKDFFSKKEVRNILEVFRLLIDAWKTGMITCQSEGAYARSLAMFLSLYLDGNRKREKVSKGEFVIDTLDYIKEQIQQPDLENDFLDEIEIFFGTEFVEIEFSYKRKVADQPRTVFPYTEGSAQDTLILSLVLDGAKVVRYKLSSPSLGGEFMAYFLTDLGTYFFCNCEVGRKGLIIINRAECTKESFDKMPVV